MNGRLYDPMLRRFLNADENIQDPHNTQNYNKYGYVFNNPLMYNDPSGELVWLPFAIAVITSLATDYYMNRPINFINIAQNIVMSYISSGVSMGVDQVFKSASVALNLGKTGSKIMSVLANGTSGAINTLMGGGNPLRGFISSTLISAGAKGLGALTKGSNRGTSIDSGGDINYKVDDNTGDIILPELELSRNKSWAEQIKNYYDRYYNDFSKAIKLGISLAGIAEGVYSTYGSRKYVFHNEIFRYNKNATYQWSNAFTTKMKNGQHYWSNNFVKNARK